jgi:hypothetical protein
MKNHKTIINIIMLCSFIVLNGCNQENEDDTLINLEESLSKMNNGLAK